MAQRQRRSERSVPPGHNKPVSDLWGFIRRKWLPPAYEGGLCDNRGQTPFSKKPGTQDDPPGAAGFNFQSETAVAAPNQPSRKFWPRVCAKQ
jgi:hypothetical protein